MSNFPKITKTKVFVLEYNGKLNIFKGKCTKSYGSFTQGKQSMKR